MKWEYDPLGYEAGAHTRVTLSNGQALWIGFQGHTDLGIFYPSLLILDNPDADMWDRDYFTEWGCDEGGNDHGKKSVKAIGPGGTEAFTTFGEALAHAEKHIIPKGGIVIIGAATERLFRIYEHFLTRRGYTRVAGDLIKEIK